jgi:hypothetical protein
MSGYSFKIAISKEIKRHLGNPPSFPPQPSPLFSRVGSHCRGLLRLRSRYLLDSSRQGGRGYEDSAYPLSRQSRPSATR